MNSTLGTRLFSLTHKNRNGDAKAIMWRIEGGGTNFLRTSSLEH